MSWSPNPTVLEVNPWTWLYELSKKHPQRVTLENVLSSKLDELARFDAVWLMEVWERRSRVEARGIRCLTEDRG